MSLSRAATRLAASKRTAQLTTGAALRASGIVPLFAGDPDFATPEWIAEAAIEAMRQGFTHYAAATGDPELREAVADSLNERHGQDFKPADVIITSGASSAVYPALATVVDPGDDVLLLNPCYSLYEDAVKIAGARAVWVPLREDFHLDPDALEASITPRSRALLLNSPCNPTTVMLTRAELEAVEAIAEKHDLVVISDEVYDRLVFDGRPYVSALDLPRLAERTMLLQSFSKTYAMTGWRVGFIAAKGGLATAAGDVHRGAVGPVSTIAQRAALAALRARPEQVSAWLDGMLAVYDRRRRLGQALLDQVPRAHSTLPEATFYFWVKVDTELTSEELIRYLRDEGGVAVRSGTEFGTGGEGYVRLTFSASDDDVREGITRMGEALARLDR